MGPNPYESPVIGECKDEISKIDKLSLHVRNLALGARTNFWYGGATQAIVVAVFLQFEWFKISPAQQVLVAALYILTAKIVRRKIIRDFNKNFPHLQGK